MEPAGEEEIEEEIDEEIEEIELELAREIEIEIEIGSEPSISGCSGGASSGGGGSMGGSLGGSMGGSIGSGGGGGGVALHGVAALHASPGDRAPTIPVERASTPLPQGSRLATWVTLGESAVDADSEAAEQQGGSVSSSTSTVGPMGASADSTVSQPAGSPVSPPPPSPLTPSQFYGRRLNGMASYGAAAASAAAATAVLAEAAATATCTAADHPWQVLAESVARRPLGFKRTPSGGHLSGAPDLFVAAAAFNTYRGYERVRVLGRGQHSVAVLLRSPASGKQVVSKHPNPNPNPSPSPNQGD